MITTLLFDFSRVLLLPKDDSFSGSLNTLHKTLSQEDAYVFFDHFRLNDELIMALKPLSKKYRLTLFTSETIQDAPAVKPLVEELFQKIYAAKKMGLSKKDSAAYTYLAKDLGETIENILFIDDNTENIAAADQAGMKTIQYKDNPSLSNTLVTEFSITLSSYA